MDLILAADALGHLPEVIAENDKFALALRGESSHEAFEISNVSEKAQGDDYIEWSCWQGEVRAIKIGNVSTRYCINAINRDVCRVPRHKALERLSAGAKIANNVSRADE